MQSIPLIWRVDPWHGPPTDGKFQAIPFVIKQGCDVDIVHSLVSLSITPVRMTPQEDDPEDPDLDTVCWLGVREDVEIHGIEANQTNVVDYRIIYINIINRALSWLNLFSSSSSTKLAY